MRLKSLDSKLKKFKMKKQLLYGLIKQFFVSNVSFLDDYSTDIQKVCANSKFAPNSAPKQLKLNNYSNGFRVQICNQRKANLKGC